MKSPSERRRARRLLKLLEALQQDDHPITAPTLVATKHHLRNTNRCPLIEVLSDESLALDEYRCETDRASLPVFILSQLEAQKLADWSSPLVSLPPPLLIILWSLPAKLVRGFAYPTLFSWYCKPKHRSYVTFAFIDRRMEPRSYTISELLALRGCQVSKQLASTAEQNADIALIFRTSPTETSESRPQPKRQKEDSSAASDEVVFNGNNNKQRRVARESLSREPLREVQQLVEQHPVERVRESEWKYRGRSDSDVTASEPFAAPDGRLTQKSEGFQRFYKAVVSPTHVRVTAGGRIVPNTRGPPSPISKRAKDSGGATESQNTANNQKQGAPGPGHSQSVPSQPFAPIIPQFLPGFAPGVQAMHPSFPFMPIAYAAAAGYPFATPGLNTAAMQAHATDSTLRETQNSKGVPNAGVTSAGSDLSDKIKISPPEQFDHTKPFLYNGQWIYPIQAAAFPHAVGAPFLPFHLVGLGPSAIQPQLPGQMMQQPPIPGMNLAAAAGAFQAGYPQTVHGLGGMMGASAPASATGSQTPAAPPMSSIRPSEITKKQIVSFRQSLKYHEDQLQYNRHQIDEKDMENKIQIFRDHIRRFEAILKTQLENEEGMNSKAGSKQGSQSGRSPVAQNTEGVHVSQKPSMGQEEKMPTVASAQSSNGAAIRETRDISSWNNSGSQHGNKSEVALSQEASQAKPGFDWAVGGSGRTAYNFGSDQSGTSFTDSCKVSSLPSEAALAPPFQPRGYTAPIWTESTHSQETQEEAERRLLAAAGWSTGEQFSGSRPLGAEFSGSFGKVNSQSTVGTGPRETKFEVPYLVGTLPAGINPRTAKDTDYKYVRPLTDDEVRARHLYWGQAPKSAKRGLPKYDGRHFYPPSPIKEVVTGSGAPEAVAQANATHSNQTMPSYGGAKMDKTNEADPFRPVTPPQHRGISKSMGGSDDSEHVPSQRARPYAIKIKSASEDTKSANAFAYDRRAEQPAQPVALRSRENSSDAISVSSHEKRTEKPGLLQAMLKKGSTSSAVSSTTAQGYLPHYKGHAAASLSPSMNKGSPSPTRDASPSKTSTSDVNDLSDGGALLTPTQEKRVENRPPRAANSMEDHMRNATAVDMTTRTAA